MSPRSIYIKVTRPNGKAYTSEHRVWDTERFYAALDKLFGSEGSKVAVTTEEEYRRGKWTNSRKR